MSTIRLLSLNDNEFLEIVKCLRSINDPVVESLRLAVKNADIKLFKKQFNELKSSLIKNNYGITKIAQQVESKFTYLTDLQMADVLYQAYKTVYGKAPNLQSLGLLWSQAAFETGKEGGKFRLRNNNFGGVTAGNFDKKWNGKGWLEAGKPYIVSSKSKMRFKAYSTPLEGAIEYVKTLVNLYPESMKWKASGLIADDVLYMATKNYFGNEKIKAYGGGMDVYMKQFMANVYPSIKGKLSEEPEPPPGPIKMQHKLYGDNPYLKNKENPVVDRVKFDSEKWGWDYKGKQVPTEKPSSTSGPVKMPDAEEMDTGVATRKTELKPVSPALPAQESKQPQESVSDDAFVAEYDNLMKILMASGPVSSLVKKAILKKKLGTNSLLITINSNSPDYVNNRFARVLSTALRQELDAETTLYFDKNAMIQCETYGSKDVISKSILEVFSYVANEFIHIGKFGIKLTDDVVDLEPFSDSEDNYRKFVLYAATRGNS